jgi:hypothetical protein
MKRHFPYWLHRKGTITEPTAALTLIDLRLEICTSERFANEEAHFSLMHRTASKCWQAGGCRVKSEFVWPIDQLLECRTTWSAECERRKNDAVALIWQDRVSVEFDRQRP